MFHNAHLSDKYLHHVVSILSSLNMVIVLGTPNDFVVPEIPQIVENKVVEVVGDTGFDSKTFVTAIWLNIFYHY